jgi:hypothetical protein
MLVAEARVEALVNQAAARSEVAAEQILAVALTPQRELARELVALAMDRVLVKGLVRVWGLEVVILRRPLLLIFPLVRLHLEQTHLEQTHLGPIHLARIHLEQTHLARIHLEQTHLERIRLE